MRSLEECVKANRLLVRTAILDSSVIAHVKGSIKTVEKARYHGARLAGV